MKTSVSKLFVLSITLFVLIFTVACVKQESNTFFDMLVEDNGVYLFEGIKWFSSEADIMEYKNYKEKDLSFFQDHAIATHNIYKFNDIDASFKKVYNFSHNQLVSGIYIAEFEDEKLIQKAHNDISSIITQQLGNPTSDPSINPLSDILWTNWIDEHEHQLCSILVYKNKEQSSYSLHIQLTAPHKDEYYVNGQN